MKWFNRNKDSQNPIRKMVMRIVWIAVGLFVVLFAIGAAVDIADYLRDPGKADRQDQEREAERAERLEAGEDYLAWFEEHNETYHARLDAYKEAVKNDWYAIPEARSELYRSLNSVRNDEYADGSPFNIDHRAYKAALYKMELAMGKKPALPEQQELMDESERLEAEAIEKIYRKKESLYEND